MSAIVDISNTFPVPPGSSARAVPPRVAPSTVLRQEDSVEISNIGRSLAYAHDPSSLNLARLRAIRLEIEKGTFETPERLQGTVDRLLQILR